MCNNNKSCSCKCKKQKVNETKLLQEVINLELSSIKKREALKQARISMDALLSLYELCHKSNVQNKNFLSILDNAYDNVNTLLTVLVVQDKSEDDETESNDIQ